MDFSNLTNPDALLRLALLLALGGAVYFGALALFTLWRLRHPSRRTYASAVARGIPGDPSEMAPDPPAFEEWSFTSGGVPFGIWDVRGDARDGPIVIVSHGWGASRIDMLNRVAALRPHASRLILWDLRGQGETPGVSTLGARESADLAELIRTVADGSGAEDGGRPSLVLYGYSLGAEVTLGALAGSGAGGLVNGVILEAPYAKGVTPARAMMKLSGFPSLVNLPIALACNALLNGRAPGDRWRDLTRHAVPLRERGTPLLVLHGDADPISPLGDGRAFADAGGGSIAVVPGGGHGDLFAHGGPARPELEAALDGFFGRLA